MNTVVYIASGDFKLDRVLDSVPEDGRLVLVTVGEVDDKMLSKLDTAISECCGASGGADRIGNCEVLYKDQFFWVKADSADCPDAGEAIRKYCASEFCTILHDNVKLSDEWFAAVKSELLDPNVGAVYSDGAGVFFPIFQPTLKTAVEPKCFAVKREFAGLSSPFQTLSTVFNSRIVKHIPSNLYYA
jgi:hypothetical protein